VTTVHAYTGDQNLTDGEHRDWRRARAAHNVIPTSTGAAEAIGTFIPELRGKVDGLAMRVPTSAVSVVDFVAELERPASVEAISQMLMEAADGALRGVLYFQPALAERWDGLAWPSARVRSHVLAALPVGTFPGVDLQEVYAFLEDQENR
jgi:glyceraldehyde 3-phosphate dehydrogenase